MGLSNNKNVRRKQLAAMYAGKGVKRPMRATFKTLKKKGLSKYGDIDKDGVVNIKDCKPLDYKKQGFLHDLQVKRLKAQEEKLEKQRQKSLDKLEDKKEILVERQKIASKKAEIRKTKLKEKQAIIDEINREKKKIADIKKANIEAKKQLDSLTTTGKAKTLAKKVGKQVGKQALKDSKLALKAGQAFLKKKSTKRTLKKIGRFFS